ncbi:hypothetical protein [Halochromatium glycolicum]|nr:hypothetical protein [Halochromatium glycolicum]
MKTVADIGQEHHPILSGKAPACSSGRGLRGRVCAGLGLITDE